MKKSLRKFLGQTSILIFSQNLHCLIRRAHLKMCLNNGGLAQLGERLLCTQEVSGSIPLFSTKRARSSAG